jgi:hypothetical protein
VGVSIFLSEHQISMNPLRRRRSTISYLSTCHSHE